MTKSIFLSRTFWGAVIALIAPFLKHLGVDLGSDDANAFTELAVGAVGFGLTIYGRWKASKQVHLIPPGTTGAGTTTYILPILMMVAVLLIAAMMGCQKNSPKHVATVGASGLSTALNIGIRLDSDLYNTRVLDKDGKSHRLIEGEEAGDIAQGIDEITSANDVFIDEVRSLPEVNADNKAQVLAWFSQLTGKAQEVEARGAFHVKNTDSKKKVDFWLATFHLSLAAMSDYIGNFSGSTTGPKFAQALTHAAEHQ